MNILVGLALLGGLIFIYLFFRGIVWFSIWRDRQILKKLRVKANWVKRAYVEAQKIGQFLPPEESFTSEEEDDFSEETNESKGIPSSAEMDSWQDVMPKVA